MKIHTMEQRTPEWDEIRAGKITGSVAKKLVTPTGKVSIQYKSEIGRIIAEEQGWQEPDFIKPTYWMERGVNLEPEARGWFQVETGLLVHQCGFMEHSSGLAGFSPDGYVIEDDQVIPVELKCPKPSNHIMWFLEGGENIVLPKDHIGQCHFGMVVADAPHMYFESYTPNASPLIVKVEWSEYTDTMAKMLDNFIFELKEAREKIIGVIE